MLSLYRKTERNSFLLFGLYQKRIKSREEIVLRFLNKYVLIPKFSLKINLTLLMLIDLVPWSAF